MSFGVGDPGNMRMCAGVLEGEASRLDVAARDVNSSLMSMSYVGPRSEKLRDSGQYLRQALSASAAILRREAGLIRMLADQVQREKEILEQRRLEAERKAAEQQRQARK